jgi:hypothetical protein
VGGNGVSHVALAALASGRCDTRVGIVRLLTSIRATAVAYGGVEAQGVVHAGAVSCAAARFARVETSRHGFTGPCLALYESIERVCEGGVVGAGDPFFARESQWQGRGQECD